MIKTISNRSVVAAIRLGLSVLGSSHEALVGGMAHGFSGPHFFRKIRKRPSRALLSVLARRLERFDESQIDLRTNRGESLLRAMNRENQELFPLGCQATIPTHWVFAVIVANPEQLTQHLWSIGFDATRHSSLSAVASEPETGSGLPVAEEILKHMVFLPIDLPMPDREIERLGNAVERIAQPIHLSTLTIQRVPPHESPTYSELR